MKIDVTYIHDTVTRVHSKMRSHCNMMPGLSLKLMRTFKSCDSELSLCEL